MISRNTYKPARKRRPQPEKRGRGRPLEIFPELRELVEAVGSLDLLADEMRVSRRTIQRWGHRQIEPSFADKIALAQIARKHACEPPWPI